MSAISQQLEERRSAALALVPDLKRAVVVARQSRTDDGSLSIADQIEKAVAYCEANGLELVATYEEPDTSGRKPLDKRKGLKRAVHDVEDNRADVIVCAYFDRFCRSVATRSEAVNRVEAKGGEVHTLDFGRTSNATAGEKLSGTLLAAISEFVADQTGEKLTVTKQRNIDKGIPPFPRVTPAYQKREDGTLEPHPHNAPIVRDLIERRLKGESLTKLVASANEQGLVHSYGEQIGEPLVITQTGLTKLFASKLLCGEIHFGTFTPNFDAIEEPIISKATFKRLQEKRATRGRYSKSERLLARLGVLVCETCGSRMSVHSTSTNGKRYEYLICGDRQCTRQAIIAADAAETFVLEQAKQLAANREGHATTDDRVEAARVAADEAEAIYTNAVDLAMRGHGNAATLDELKTDRDAKVERHERLARLVAPAMTATAADVDGAPLELKREFIVAFVERAIVTPGRGAGRIAIVPKETI